MVVLKVLQDFADKTSIHGLVYLVRPDSSSRKKIIWAISIVVAMMYATLEMRNSVNGKYHSQSRKNRGCPSLISNMEMQFLAVCAALKKLPKKVQL